MSAMSAYFRRSALRRAPRRKDLVRPPDGYGHSVERGGQKSSRTWLRKERAAYNRSGSKCRFNKQILPRHARLNCRLSRL